ncbi:hypothetical protein HPB48_023209 [Haemaphysalis longicornis]|uniref:Uncharacterized protein n=1 Tax=Haemaphysalis longicornis TaxID=44386 RepID=A0A9J6H704_HAELO|nr:hypothetical protein HPB48_023209 [Haemaphysalis longicornis]
MPGPGLEAAFVVLPPRWSAQRRRWLLLGAHRTSASANAEEGGAISRPREAAHRAAHSLYGLRGAVLAYSWARSPRGGGWPGWLAAGLAWCGGVVVGGSLEPWAHEIEGRLNPYEIECPVPSRQRAPADAAVKVMKSSFEKTGDAYETLLAYRTIPLKNRYSPAELLIGRRPGTSMRLSLDSLVPSLLDS